MGGIAHKEQSSEAHRFGHEGAQRGDGFLERWSDYHGFGVMCWKTSAQFIVETLVAPVFDCFVKRALNIITAAREGPHGAKCKAPFVVRIDQFVRNGRNIRQYSKPAERIDLFKNVDCFFRNGFAAIAVISVTSGDEIAIDTMGFAIFLEGDIW